MANMDEESLLNKPTFLEHTSMRFLIMDAPTNVNLNAYINVLLKKKVAAVARACEPSYDAEPLVDSGIRVLDVCFADGEPPPMEVVNRWLSLVHDVFVKNKNAKAEEPAIAVHCVAGLGRAPVLVAIALVEGGMEPLDAVEFIRKKRRGAINARQLKWLTGYKRQGIMSAGGGGCCIIS